MNYTHIPFYRWRLLIERIKGLMVNIVCGFIPSKKYRILVREYFLLYRICPGHPPLPVKKRLQPINLAFGFNLGFARQTGVAIASLLANSKNRCAYNIYCVVDNSVTPELRDSLAGLVKTLDHDSSITFLEANRDFDQSLRGSWSLGVYYRLMLPALLPELDNIIYADGDVIFCRDLLELADLDMGEHLVAGVQEKPGGYINSGFLVLNLAQIRQEKTYEVWLETSRRKQYAYPDQDLLNVTCQDRILYLPIKYNFLRTYYMIYRRGLIHPYDHHDLKYNTVMLHYFGGLKPWHSTRYYLHDLWWKYARLTPFYEDMLAKLKT
ncbi:MAG: glycosyltransferase family 8 protein [Syntrophorhabdaceae bacterium]|nr:glycosyltransferase family 8 protein [Syntrophorhabdaceae bacterium]